MANILDLFATDPMFSLTNLTQAIIDIPYHPTKIQRLGLFNNVPIDSMNVLIERTTEKLSLVPSAPRGAPGVVKGLQKSNVRTLRTTHLPQTTSILADEVQNVRAFGKTTESEILMNRLMRKIRVCRQDLDLTIEWQRMGALKGQVLDADGVTVLWDLFSEFGLTKMALNMGLSSDSTKVLQKVVSAKRMAEDQLGGVYMSGFRAECSPEFMDKFTSHPAVVDAWRYYQAQNNQADYRDGTDGLGGFKFGDVIWSEMRSNIPGVPKFIDAGKALLIPLGVPEMFTTYYAPANYMETVNTDGLPFYAKQEPMDFGKGINAETQSNPLHVNNRPNAIIELTA